MIKSNTIILLLRGLPNCDKYEILVLSKIVMIMRLAIIVHRDVGGAALEGIKVTESVN